MRVPGLPPELLGLLGRLQARGLAVGALELGRLQHLLAQAGALGCAPDRSGPDLADLLVTVLCKDDPQRALLRREYAAWAADFEAPTGADRASAREQGAGLLRGEPDGLRSGLESGAEAPGPAPRGRRRWRWIAVAGLVLLCALGAWWLWQRPPVTPPVAPGPGGAAEPVPTGAPCPQDRPTEPVPEVWAWEPVPGLGPWGAIGGGLAFLVLALAAALRLWWVPSRWLRGRLEPGADGPPRRGLPRRPVHGDLLLTPVARRELIWSVDHYVGEDPEPVLDAPATVAASARAAGVPHLLWRRRTWPRQVWLWCDRRSARPALMDLLVLEVCRALEGAQLPVRVARFHGLPIRLTWDDTRESWVPASQTGAGAAALIAVLTDGAALVRAWDNPGERPRLDALLRELRAWPRLVLVDLGAGDLSRLAPGWRLPVQGPAGLPAWLAAASGRGLAGPEPGAPSGIGVPAPAPPDPAQLGLWAAACRLGPELPGEAEALRLRRELGLRVGPFDLGALRDLLARCAVEPGLAADLMDRLDRSQAADAQGLPTGDGYLHRALEYWDRRLAAAASALAEDPAARVRVQVARALLLLRRDPEAGAAALAGIGGTRAAALIRAALSGYRPAWDLARLPLATRWRLRRLGLGGQPPGHYTLGPGRRHQLALALLAGVGLGGLGLGLWRLLDPHRGTGAFAGAAFQARVIAAPGPGATWLGSPWRLTALPHLGPVQTPHTWAWRSAANPERLEPGAEVLTGGTRAYPIRACTPGWPRRSLAAIAAPAGDPAARQLAIRLLDRGAADRVLIASDWAGRLGGLTQGVRVAGAGDGAGDQLLVFLPRGDGAGAEEGLGGAGDGPAPFGALAEVRGDFEELAAALDFSGTSPVAEAWPAAQTRVLAGAPQVAGGPVIETDDRGVTWVGVCGGTFRMGSEAPDDATLERWAQSYVDAFGGTLDERRNDWRRWLAYERPVHPVLVDDFVLARTELTLGQHRAAGGTTEGEAALPLARIDFKEARDACKDLGATLPTEAEWEYAARAGTATRWSFGDDEGQLSKFGWYRNNAGAKAHPVSDKLPNGLCLADLQGNVYEWTDTCFDSAAYAKRGPLTVDPPADRPDCEWRVVRGGSFFFPPGFLRPAGRVAGQPDDRFENLGLRCVRSRARQQ